MPVRGMRQRQSFRVEDGHTRVEVHLDGAAATCKPYLQVRTEGARQTQRPQIAKTRPKNRLRD
jgi:hypothetical protein